MVKTLPAGVMSRVLLLSYAKGSAPEHREGITLGSAELHS